MMSLLALMIGVRLGTIGNDGRRAATKKSVAASLL